VFPKKNDFRLENIQFAIEFFIFGSIFFALQKHADRIPEDEGNSACQKGRRRGKAAKD
jgi:hypothetical protein